MSTFVRRWIDLRLLGIAMLSASLAPLSVCPVTADETPRFIRGDANTDGRVTLSDVFAIYRYLHLGTSLPCQKAADVDDDGKVQSFDALTLLGSIFYRHGPPPPPFQRPGADLTADSLTCRQGLRGANLNQAGDSPDDPEADPADGTSTDCDEDGGGPDLEFIHFRGGVLVSPGETKVRVPIYFSSGGGVEGITLSLYAPPEVLEIEKIDFAPLPIDSPITSKAWTHTFSGKQKAGYLASTLMLSLDESETALPKLYNDVVAYVELNVKPEAVIGTTTRIVFADTPAEDGLPAIPNEVSRKAAIQPRHFCGLRVEVVSGEDVFIRGDSNRDRAVNLVDAVFILHNLFAKDLFAEVLPCPDAADVNDNGVVDLTDAVGLVQYLFLHGAAPSAPYPGAGRDTDTLDGLGCAEGRE